MKEKNWFQIMQTGIYDVFVDSMALYDASADSQYVKGYKLSNHGTLVTEDEEIILASITILTMIEIDKKGYRFSIKNKNLIKEIVEIIYNHITVCMKVKSLNPLGEYPVPLEDLIDMETFMMKVIEANPKLLVDSFAETLEYRLKSSKMMTRFDRIGDTTAKENPKDAYRRVTKKNSLYGDINIDDILNDI